MLEHREYVCEGEDFQRDHASGNECNVVSTFDSWEMGAQCVKKAKKKQRSRQFIKTYVWRCIIYTNIHKYIINKWKGNIGVRFVRCLWCIEEA